MFKNTVRCVRTMRTFCEIQLGDLGAGIVNQPCGGDKRRHRCNGNDMALLPLKHAREELADQHKVRDQIYLE